MADDAPSVDDLLAQTQALRAGVKGAAGATPAAPGSAQAPSPDDLMALTRSVVPSRGGPSVVPDASQAKPGDIDPITGKPYQFATAGTPGPVGASTGQPISEDMLPGPGTQAAGSMATDPQQRLRIVAKQLFPDLSDKDAQSRMFYGPNGRLAAVNQDGVPFYVDPAATVSTDPYSPGSIAGNITNVPTRVAASAGPALPAIGGAVTGLASGPSSLVMGPLNAAAGAAAGDVARQTIANKLDPGNAWTGERTPYNPWQTVTEAAGAGAGQLTGALALRAFSPGMALTPAEIRLLRKDPAVLSEANALQERAANIGVDLTPGQATGLPSLLGREDVVASGAAGPDKSDIAQAFYARQRQQLQDAYRAHLDTLSSASDKTDAAMQFQQAAEDAQRIVRQEANRVARPSYQAAESAGQVMSPDLAQLADTPAVKDAMAAARKDYQNLYRKPAPDTPDFQLWDLTKRKLDDAVGVARNAGENTTAGSLDSIRSDLVSNLDAAYPTYATARVASAPGQRLAARLEESVGGAQGAGMGTEKAKAIVSPVFESNNPNAIAEARTAFANAGREDEWNAGVRAYLQDTIDKASKSDQGLNPQMLRRQLWADPDRKAAMQAAMGPQAFQGFQNVMEAMEAAAKSRGLNSLTEPRRVGAAAFQEAAADAPSVRAANLLGQVFSPKLLYSIPAVTDRIAQAITRQNMAGMADRMFSPDGLKFLSQAAMMAPGSQRLAALTAEFLGQQQGTPPRVVGPVAQANALRPPWSRGSALAQP